MIQVPVQVASLEKPSWRGKQEPDSYWGEVTHPRQAGEQLLPATTGPAGSRNFCPGARLAQLVFP